MSAPKDDAVGPLRSEVSDNQCRVLEILREVYLESGDWPTHGYLEQQLEFEGIELDDELGTMPKGMFFPDKRFGGGAVLLQEDEKVSLGVRGLGACRGAERELRMFVASIRWGVAARRSLKRAVNAPTAATWRAADVMRAMEDEVGTPLGAREAKLVLELMRDEGGLPRWSGVPDAFPDWSVQIPQDIRHFRGVETIDDYFALTAARPNEPIVLPAQVTSVATAPTPSAGEGGEAVHTEPSLRLLRLVRDVLEALDAGEALSACLMRAVRIARLAEDLEAVYWLELEQRNVGAEHEKEDIGREMHVLRTQPGWNATHEAALERYIERRTVDSGIRDGKAKTLVLTVSELENIMSWPEEARADADGLWTFHAATTVISRVRPAVHRYLSRLESRLSKANPQEALSVALVSGIDARLLGAARSLEGGQLDSAVHDAFKRVEIAIREAGSFPQDLVGLDLVTAAFRVPGGTKQPGLSRIQTCRALSRRRSWPCSEVQWAFSATLRVTGIALTTLERSPDCCCMRKRYWSWSTLQPGAVSQSHRRLLPIGAGVKSRFVV